MKAISNAKLVSSTRVVDDEQDTFNVVGDEGGGRRTIAAGELSGAPAHEIIQNPLGIMSCEGHKIIDQNALFATACRFSNLG